MGTGQTFLGYEKGQGNDLRGGGRSRPVNSFCQKNDVCFASLHRNPHFPGPFRAKTICPFMQVINPLTRGEIGIQSNSYKAV